MKKLKYLILIVLIAALPAAMFSCNKDDGDGIDLLRYYRNSSSVKEYTDAARQSTLPEGWSVFTVTESSASNTDSDVGYIPDLDAFVVSNKTSEKDYNYNLSLVKAGSDELLIPASVAIVALRVKGDIIAVRTGGGTAAVYNSSGRLIISGRKIQNVGTVALDKIINILDEDLIAVNPNYDVDTQAAGVTGYTPIYRFSTGKLACRIRNSGSDVSKLSGFDTKYVLASKTTENGVETSKIFRIPDGAPAAPANIDAPSNATVEDNGSNDYYNEITYIGNDRFFIHEDWTVTKEDGYTYYYNEEYVKTVRHIYYPEADRLESYSSPHIFLNLTNRYYDGARTGIEASSFLNDGYMYASYCIYVPADRNGEYDQYILDSNLSVVLSLTGNFGVNTKKAQLVDEVGFYDLALQFVDGRAVAPLLPSIMRLYDRHGNILFEDKTHTINLASQQNGMIIASVKDENDKSLFGAYNLEGQLVIPFNYTKISPFTGFYTVAEKIVENRTVRVLIGKDGREVTALSDNSEPLSDMATTQSGTPLFKQGCYVYKVDSGNKDENDKPVYLYGVKNFNADVSKNTVMEASATACTIYSPSSSPQIAFVFVKFSGSDVWSIYRMI